MTVAEDIAALKQGQVELQKTAAEQMAGQARVEGAINTLAARVDAHMETNSDAMKALFAGRRDHASKIEDIRVDYVPKGDFDAHTQMNRKDHAAVMSAVNCVQWKVAKMAGGITLLAFLAGLLVKGIGVFAK